MDVANHDAVPHEKESEVKSPGVCKSWSALRFQIARLVQNRFFEWFILSMIVISSACLVSGIVLAFCSYVIFFSNFLAFRHLNMTILWLPCKLDKKFVELLCFFYNPSGTLDTYSCHRNVLKIEIKHVNTNGKICQISHVFLDYLFAFFVRFLYCLLVYLLKPLLISPSNRIRQSPYQTNHLQLTRKPA